VVKAMHWPLYPWERDTVPIVQEAGWALGPVWMGLENLPQVGFEPQTVQPILSAYTAYATLAAHSLIYNHYIIKFYYHLVIHVP
jgi:hypothetical protein